MNPVDDYVGEMPTPLIDDAMAEALITRGAVAAELEPLAAIVQALRDVSDRPVPPSPALAAQMASGVFTGTAEHSSPVVGVVASVAAKARISLAAKAGAACLAVASVGAGSAGFAGVLPGTVQHRFETVVESITPYEFPVEPDGNDGFRPRVSEDGKDGGVDDGEVSEEARDRGTRARPTDLPIPGSGAGKPSHLPTQATVPSNAPAQPGPPPAPPGLELRPTAPPQP